ncbi:hypothetical protein [Marinitenerispora sediminis]|nr:hypothetical protein [Marinitenerispora sediminis]RCV57608.1 hypothetical protein DEF28_01445 [Marinitenerispora sediminis]
MRVHRIHVPAPSVPSGQEVARAGRSVAEHLPSPGQCAYYTGLGALAVFGVIEWPVAAAIGVGTAVARRARGGWAAATQGEPGRSERPGKEAAAAKGAEPAS